MGLGIKSGVDQNVKHVAQVNLRDMLDLAKPLEEQSFLLQVNHNTFKVSIDEKGTLDVGFKGGWFNGWRKETRNRLQSLLTEQLKDIAGRYAAANGDKFETLKANTLHEVETRFGADSTQEVAMYGFKHVRSAVMKPAYIHNITATSIDNYNQGLGIMWTAISIDTVDTVVDGLRKNETPGPRPGYQPTGGVSLERLPRWGRFLHENADKLDIFGRINGYIEAAGNKSRYRNATGWKGEAARRGIEKMMESLVRKNIGTNQVLAGLHFTSDKDIKAVAKTLVEVAKNKARNLDVDWRDILKRKLREVGYSKKEIESTFLFDGIQTLCEDVVRVMFFRQTSKLGLDFFKKEGVPVMFQWSTHKGISMENAGNTLKNKWWQDNSDSIRNHIGAAITFSEMRHAEKMMADADDPVNIVKVYGVKV